MISDSMCAGKHESGAEGQDTTDVECTRACVKGGSKYVLLVDGDVLAIANQDHAALAEFAGTRVVATGTRSGAAIEILRIEKAR